MTKMTGAFIIDKPAGLTSHDVVARVRRIIGERRVGHTGTLDPFATGVLVILVGRATRLAQFLSGAEKEYEGTVRLGYATDTGDATGQPVQNDSPTDAAPVPQFHRDDVEAALATLRGQIEQVPPMYSARKIDGRKLYELARQGTKVERAPVRITVSEFEVIPRNGRVMSGAINATADLHVRVVCSAGTYVRALAEDLGKRLGLGAHLAELRRTRAGHFRIAEAMTLEQLADLAQANLVQSKIISADSVLSDLPAIDLTADEVIRAIHGNNIPVAEPSNLMDGQRVRLRNPDNQLVAVGAFDETRRIVHPEVVIAG